MTEANSLRRSMLGAGVLLGGLGLTRGAPAQVREQGVVTTRSANSVADTIARFKDAVTAEGWVVFTEIDHAAAAEAVGMKLLPRTVVLFGNPRTGTPAMAAHPVLALDLPMRVLIWQDASGVVWMTRSTGDDVATRVFGRHGVNVAEAGRRSMDALFNKFVTAATA